MLIGLILGRLRSPCVDLFAKHLMMLNLVTSSVSSVGRLSAYLRILKVLVEVQLLAFFLGSEIYAIRTSNSVKDHWLLQSALRLGYLDLKHQIRPISWVWSPLQVAPLFYSYFRILIESCCLSPEDLHLRAYVGRGHHDQVCHSCQGLRHSVWSPCQVSVEVRLTQALGCSLGLDFMVRHRSLEHRSFAGDLKIYHMLKLELIILDQVCLQQENSSRHRTPQSCCFEGHICGGHNALRRSQ